MTGCPLLEADAVQKMPPDLPKINRSFAHDILHDDKAIARSRIH